ncbi:hypothetical protein GCM10011351_00550 [Paraliobacillus quinghaiensis]|uniref:DUF3231 family protein n=1 Tax=Paraliobacillus quinghaiensis TaxID=470815 RepID=A0A917TFC6_9BACI|nr:DUF3231 family protein [Paraliobacillus quinghaiensis]GGM18646.1 hypothetical protein GCM10011351_00550 [Paraliobacillus quinghaiensis]
MEKGKNIQLTAPEIGSMWAVYLSDTASICISKHFKETVEDLETKTIIERALTLSEKHVEKIAHIFRQEQYPVPMGFTDADYNVGTPRLYSDEFYLIYTYAMSRIGLHNYSLMLSNVIREDIRNFFSECVKETVTLYNESSEVLLSKGLARRAPHIPTPQGIDFVEKQNFLTGWIGEKRPINAIEITEFFFNVHRNDLGMYLLTGFAQVAQSKELVSFFMRGKEISKKHVEIFESILKDNDVSGSLTWNINISNSTLPPFSDKLMLFLVNALNGVGIGYYGLGMGVSMRRDFPVDFSRLIAEVGLFAEDGMNIMIKNKWLEQPPQATDREKLAKNKSNLT